MKVTLELTQAEIYKAIAQYLKEQGIPTKDDGTDFSFEVFFNKEKIMESECLAVKLNFNAENYYTGPYR